MKYRVIYHQVRVDTFKNSVPLCLPRLLIDSSIGRYGGRREDLKGR